MTYFKLPTHIFPFHSPHSTSRRWKNNNACGLAALKYPKDTLKMTGNHAKITGSSRPSSSSSSLVAAGIHHRNRIGYEVVRYSEFI
jgi:hypothetical protein